MTFAENGGFLMALLFAHFISSRVHRRVTRAHRLAGSLPCTGILKNNREFGLSLLCIRTAKIWTSEFDRRSQICGRLDPDQAKDANEQNAFHKARTEYVSYLFGHFKGETTRYYTRSYSFVIVRPC